MPVKQDGTPLDYIRLDYIRLDQKDEESFSPNP